MKSDQLTLREIAIVIAGKNHNPSILNPDFLRHNDIVPGGLELADEPPISTPMLSQVVYKGGLRIVSEANRISFVESILGEKTPECPDMARRYLREVPHVSYTAVGINPVGVWSAKEQLSPAILLKAGKRMQFDGVSPSAEVALTYKLGKRTVNLTVRSDDLQAVAFHGNFHYGIKAANNESHMAAHAVVGEWEQCVKDFRRLAESIAKEIKK